ncbi:hypothetical protein EMIHUDRAFT_208556 [Emiliania huxleyi CCMP1516]|uniref:Uncharacterized protein n=2 Tax=Emiliania huxleyi TaxID=2903 RepID=A0A0D3JAS0_EMIH1|nr:hypothetical protein EMIHUDRAFT_208556 [Emiliania huxleyi CCMP1516]EOD20605.1 hypothetical protein EMIHUDRAFT_208556 [Emiliania huxleyi CCMP1516]|eukprot:XP_005773034.1 hypothetical protein EMIHUDRAFT_208556 [Emiliania huxleyi CCMP1516]
MFFAFVATAALSPQPPPSRAGRREVLFAVAAGSLAAPSALLSAPRQARASYAMYQASQKSFDERKADKNWKPVATSDRDSLAQAQSQVAALRAYPAARSARAFQRRAPRAAVLSRRRSYLGYRNHFTSLPADIPAHFGNRRQRLAASAFERTSALRAHHNLSAYAYSH